MARLGKREREAKRALIKGNLNNMGSLERSSGTMGSTLNRDRMLARTHVGFRDAHNVKGSIGGRSEFVAVKPNAKMGDGRAAYVAKK